MANKSFRISLENQGLLDDLVDHGALKDQGRLINQLLLIGIEAVKARPRLLLGQPKRRAKKKGGDR